MIETNYIAEDTLFVITVTGDLSGDLLKSFHQSYAHAQELHAEITQYLVDLTQAHYIDSMGLGMLLALEEFAEAHQAKIHLKIKHKNIIKLFNIANFYEIFSIEHVE